MKKMTNGVHSQYVPDAFVPGYRERGYHIEGEEVNNQLYNVGQIAVDPPAAAEPQDGTGEECPAEESGELPCEGPFICPVCDKEYKTKANLENHMASKHPED